VVECIFGCWCVCVDDAGFAGEVGTNSIVGGGVNSIVGDVVDAVGRDDMGMSACKCMCSCVG